jgi:peptide/nickel transport system permease protein
MGRYALLRVIQAIPTLLGITIVSFILAHIAPGGPAEAMLGPKAANVKLLAAINRELGLNRPLYVQYMDWFWQLVHGNLGTSYFQNEPVTTLFAAAIPRTLAVVGLSILFAHLFAVVLGSFQAYYKNRWFDHVITAVNYFLYSMPTFWIAVLLLIWFAVDLKWFPVISQPEPGVHLTFWGWLRNVTLPAATLFVTSVAGWARYMKSAMIDTLVMDYVRTARAKGLSELAVVLKHALRNSLLPLITLVGLSIPGLFSGAIFVEEIFDYPGMGLLTYNAALQKDYPVIMGAVLLTGVLVILGNLLADILYALVDPRIQYR